MPFKPLLEIANHLGFSDLRFTSFNPQNPQLSLFDTWLNMGFAGEMNYLFRQQEKRKNPHLLLENFKSFIILSFNYSQAKPPQVFQSPFISRYAWVEDYHDILSQKLEQFIKQACLLYPNENFKAYVDTGPILEKTWAAQAGLGWQGKHTNLISPKQGSYFFLTTILTTLDLPHSPALSDHCGKCQACIEICPTKAIVAPYVLDASRCISYLTIELKGPIPKELRKLIGLHVFGCDDCQEVCPWNRKSKLPEEFLRNTPLNELIYYLKMNTQEFKQHFKGSSILRTKRRGFLRNVCVVLGNLANPKSIPHLLEALNDSEELIRGHAAWALGQFNLTENELAQLRERCISEKITWVKEEIETALKRGE